MQYSNRPSHKSLSLRSSALWQLTVFAALIAAVAIYFWPFFQLVINTLTWSEGSRRISREAVPGEFTWFYWLQVTAGPISGKMLYGPLMNTLITGIISTVLALIAGGTLAWCVVRSNMPGKRWLQPILTVFPSFAFPDRYPGK